MKNRAKREQISLIILSVIDLLAGILSIVLSYLSVQIIAALASGATLWKAVKIAIQAKKAEDLLKVAKPVITKVAVKILPIVATKMITTMTKSNKENITMKAFFAKLGLNLKNNPATIITIVLESLCCSAGGFALCHYDCLEAIPAPYNLVVEILLTLIIWAGLSVLTAYLGYDNEIFAQIRKYIKIIGKNNNSDVLKALDDICTNVEKAREIEAEKEKALAEQKAKDDAIYAKILEEEKAAAEQKAKEDAEKAEAEKQAKIAAYKLAHPEVEEQPQEETVVVINEEQPNPPTPLVF